MSDWENQIHTAWKQYANIEQLAASDLAKTSACEALLWKCGDPIRDRGYAVRVLLHWTLQQLERKGGKRNNGYVEALRECYIGKKGIAEYAARQVYTKRAIQKRLVAASKQCATLLAASDWQDAAFVSACRDLTVQMRYEQLSAEAKLVAQYLALFEQPETARFVSNISELPVAGCLPNLQSIGLLPTIEEQKAIVYPAARLWLQAQSNVADSRRWHWKIGQLYEQAANVLQAVWHWQKAQRWQSALKLLLQYRADLSRNTSLERWQKRVDAFDGQLSQSEMLANWHILRGQIWELRDNLQKAVDAYEAVLSTPDLQIETRLEALYRLAHAYQERDAKFAAIYLGRMLELDDESGSPWTIRGLALWAWLRIEQLKDIEGGYALLVRIQDQIQQIEASAELRAKYHNTWTEYHRRSEPHDCDEYIKHAQKAHLFALESADIIYQLKMQYNLGLAYLHCKRNDEALLCLERNFEAAKANGIGWLAAQNRNAIGRYWLERAYVPKLAIEAYSEAYAYYAATDNKRSCAAACLGLVWACMEGCQPALARRYFVEGRELAIGLGHKGILKELVWHEKTYAELSHTLSLNQENALCYVRQHQSITNRNYREINAVSNGTASKELNQLVKLGILVRKGSGRNTHYRLVNSAEY